MQQINIVISGFTPYEGIDVNPAVLVPAAVAKQWADPAQSQAISEELLQDIAVTVTNVTLPASFAKAWPTLLEAIEQSLIQACKNHFGKADNVHVTIDPETCDFSVYADRNVVEYVEDPALEISLADALKITSRAEIGGIVQVPIQSKEFGRIATQNAKNVILQKIREEERKVLFDEYYGKEKEVITGIVQRVMGKNVSINLGKADAVLSENEQVKGETFKPTERIKVYILEVKDTPKGPRILVSRTHPGLV